MAKRTSPVKEEECSVAAAAGGIQDGEIGKDDDELKYARAEVEEAREENERLKKVVTRTVKDYEALQMHFFDVMDVQQEPAARSTPRERRRADDNFEEPTELVSLRLGTSAINAEVHEKKDNRKRSKEEDDIGGFTLGLDYSKFGSSSHSAMIKRPPPSSDEEPKEEEAVEPWPPSAKNSRSEDEEVKPLQAHIVKRARVSVRARCNTPTMNDGCQWRKYGQKVSKGNPCPRAYYRCTCAPMCPVRKQVQRCAEDTSILITTYEGSHNHPLPISATAMASTTSAAACMLTSGSSAPRLSGTFATSSSSSSSPQSAYPYNYSPISSHPTITLDLTDSKYNSSNFAPAAVPTTLNFSSSIDQSNSMPSWTSSCTSHPYSSLNQTCWQRAATSALPPPAPNNLSSTDTIARAITSDSSFQSALAAAITSYVENIANIASGNLVNVGAYGYSRYLNRSTSLLGSSRRGGSTLLRPPAPVISSGPKSASGSPVDEMEHAC